MGNLGFGEVVLILLVLLLVFGTSRLPALGDAVGKGIRNFRRGVKPDPGVQAPHEPAGAGHASAEGKDEPKR